MKNLANALETFIELEDERKELEDLGLEDIEIEGYFDFYIDNYFKVVDTKSTVLN
jgi:hypothetical protein